MVIEGIFDGIPKDLDEAVLIDGGNYFTVIFRIIIPQAAPGIAITALLSWIFAWNEYLLAATLTSVYASTIPTGLAEFVTTTGTNWGSMAAVGFVSMLPCLGFYQSCTKTHCIWFNLWGSERIEMKKGFLPIKTNWFDRLFISVITFIGIQFIWMRFVEEFAAIEVSMIFGFILGIYIILRG